MSQRTQCEQAGQGEGGPGDASVLLGLEGIAVREVVPDGFGVRWVHLVTDTDVAAACPECGVISTSGKGSATTPPGPGVRAGPDPVGVAQAAVALPPGGVWAGDVHGVPACRAGWG